METNWKIRAITPEEQARVIRLAEELRISEVSARLLVVRGMRTADEARAYIRPSLSQLNDPYQMRDMDKAVERIERAYQTKEHIMVYGDYDVDGTTAVALTYTYLRRWAEKTDESVRPELEYYIPDRYTEGYGISYQGIDTARQHGCTLIIALDCGIKAMEKVAYAREKGIDFIICDHHTPDETIPEAIAVLDAERRDNTYPYDKLSGCGVGFKLCQALDIRRGASTGVVPSEELQTLLPLTAMAIASDIVPMTGENRILAHQGLKQLNSAPSVGIAALCEVAGIAGREINMSDLGYKIGPRINACGRLYSGREAVELLLTEDREMAVERAKAIDEHNHERRECQDTTNEEAQQILEADPENANRYTTVVYNPGWNKGVVGLAAARLTEVYYRPTIILTSGEDGIISGSARSVSDFNLYDAIDSCRDLLTNFGGHAFAAGLSMKESDLPEFKRRFEEYVRTHITPEQRQPTIEIEDEIRLGDITPQLWQVIRCLEPFGPENPTPVFVTRGLRNSRYTRRCGTNGAHLKLDLSDGTGTIGGIAFGQGEEWGLRLQQGESVDIAYELAPNTFNGRTSVEMQAKSIKQ